MTVFFSGKQVVPVDYEAEVSQRLLEASLAGDVRSALECISDDFIDVNFVGAVSLKCRKTEVVLRDECPCEVRVSYEEFKTDVSALFLAVHAGNVTLVNKLLSKGADVNQRLFRGFATTAAVREGHLEILELLLKAGASQPACEEALLEASCHGQAKLVEPLMTSDLIRPHIAIHALVTACCRGFADVVHTLVKCGVDVGKSDRMLLLSSKPSLHTNVDCTPLVAAVISRQVDVVRMLLKDGGRTNVEVRLGAWSWDVNTGEEFRVGAGLSEPYDITWCAVEYFEITGSILRMLLQHSSPNTPQHGRTLLHHAILCGNAGALGVLLSCGADTEYPVKTAKTEFRPIHMAARLGLSTAIQCLIDSGCEINSRTDAGDTALMISAKYKHEECVRVLAKAGADFGLVNIASQSGSSIARTNKWSLGFQQTVLDVIKTGKVVISSNFSVFSPLLFAAEAGDVEALKVIASLLEMDLDYQDDNGFSAVMFTAKNGHVEAFRLLVYAGADVKLLNKAGESAITLSEMNQNHDLFEKVMLEFALERGNRNAGGFYALHCAARRGDMDAVKLLTRMGYDVNISDGDGYTPLMLAAREDHGSMCELLISCGAKCELKNNRGETALSVARKYAKKGNKAEEVILDELARTLVFGGSDVVKFTKQGKGAPHIKKIVMVKETGVFQWGKSSRRNVICKEAEVGGSAVFRRNRRKKDDGDRPGIFRIITSKNKEFHFVCKGGIEMAELWVRGIKLLTRT
ncbi:Protein phosphatase 1 regulatory subunit 12A [Euphorbia peplus]|nr:Protein phosphatase 1 regulatory subunit 12A [Euphorbia peplus]